MCVDYTDLNKHCPKDPFKLPRIDQVVDSKEDKEKITSITPFRAFCYTSMPFGVKNAGATYQRAIQTCLANH
jgi:hypothetical protein